MPLRYSPLAESDLAELEVALRRDEVYRHIGGVPSREDFLRRTRRALAGPPPDRPEERWLNYAVRLADSGRLVGRLEATVHDGLAEVAFLFDPDCWGRGYATRGLLWLHDELARVEGVQSLWGTTVPANERSAALMLRCGYVEVSPPTDVRLYSFDEGDRVFRLQP